ncbi:MAG: hypothetical protein O7H41_19695 [Planctomycetota bacterium]|nr:hypothetical protein [Planctomycetota bacterium]
MRSKKSRAGTIKKTGTVWAIMAAIAVPLLAFAWRDAIFGAAIIIALGIPAFVVAWLWNKLEGEQDVQDGQDDDWITPRQRGRLEEYAKELGWCVMQLQRPNFTQIHGHEVVDRLGEAVRGLRNYFELDMERTDVADHIFLGIGLDRVNIETHWTDGNILRHAETLLERLKERLK